MIKRWKIGILVLLLCVVYLLFLSYLVYSDGGYIIIPLEDYTQQLNDYKELQSQYDNCLSLIMSVLKYPNLIDSLIAQYEENLTEYEKSQEKSLKIIETETGNLEKSTMKEEELLKESSGLLQNLEKDLTDSTNDLKNLEKKIINAEIVVGSICFITGFTAGMLVVASLLK